jgi:hypothetical protein
VNPAHGSVRGRTRAGRSVDEQSGSAVETTAAEDGLPYTTMCEAMPAMSGERSNTAAISCEQRAEDRGLAPTREREQVRGRGRGRSRRFETGGAEGDTIDTVMAHFSLGETRGGGSGASREESNATRLPDSHPPSVQTPPTSTARDRGRGRGQAVGRGRGRRESSGREGGPGVSQGGRGARLRVEEAWTRVEAGEWVQGRLRVNSKNPSEAFVSVSVLGFGIDQRVA